MRENPAHHPTPATADTDAELIRAHNAVTSQPLNPTMHMHPICSVAAHLAVTKKSCEVVALAYTRHECIALQVVNLVHINAVGGIGYNLWQAVNKHIRCSVCL
jgi:hypothetical protein